MTGISFLIDCFASLSPKKNNYKLILVGEGILKSSVNEQVRAKDLSEYVYFVGFDDYLYKFFAKADLFLFPSIIEGFGNVLVEAQYVGVPICASNIGPHYESVYHKYHEFFFNPTDINSALSSIHKIMKEIKSSKLKVIIEEAKMFTIENFDGASMCDKLLEVYNEKLIKRQ